MNVSEAFVRSVVGTHLYTCKVTIWSTFVVLFCAQRHLKVGHKGKGLGPELAYKISYDHLNYDYDLSQNYREPMLRHTVVSSYDKTVR